MLFSLPRRGIALAFALSLISTVSSASETISVVDESQQPIANARILIGYEVGAPFAGNQLTTAADGVATVPDDWKAALPLTVQAPGFITLTLPIAQPGLHTLVLSRQEPAGALEVKGTTSGYGRLVSDGKVDFGLVIPALSREQMLSFDLSTVISPQNDTIEVVGNKVEIPTNITLPDQRETYIFPIQLNKPDYRLYMRQPGDYKVGIAHGQFPLQKVVNDIRAGKSFLEVVNQFDFKEYGERNVTVNGNLAGIDLSVNQTPFNTQFAVRAPSFAANQVMLAMGLIESGGQFLPSDVKRFTPGQSLNLKTNTSAGAPSLLAMLMESNNVLVNAIGETLYNWFGAIDPAIGSHMNVLATNATGPTFNRLSFTLVPATGGAQPEFLPLVNAPTLSGQVLRFQPPNVPAGLSPVAMYITLSEIEKIGSGNTQIERRTRQWEIWSEPWLNQFELPKVAMARRADRSYRWEVLFLARPSHFWGVSGSPSRVDLNSITHATRNTLDL